MSREEETSSRLLISWFGSLSNKGIINFVVSFWAKGHFEGSLIFNTVELLITAAQDVGTPFLLTSKNHLHIMTLLP